jgi:hypothetical protein
MSGQLYAFADGAYLTGVGIRHLDEAPSGLDPERYRTGDAEGVATWREIACEG